MQGISVDMALASGINNGLVTLGINSAFLAVLWYGGTLVLAEQLSVGDLAAFSLYSLFVGGSATGLATAYGDLMQAAGAADRVFALTQPYQSARISDPTSKVLQSMSNAAATTTVAQSSPMLRPAVAAESSGPELQFESVSFAYPTRPDAEILCGFDLSVHPGETVAVVGASGSGKSTLLALLTALYPVSGGRILFDGHPVCGLDPTWLRDQIGVVTQEPVIFGGTIRKCDVYILPLMLCSRR